MKKLDLLIIGSGGREHALAWKLAQSPLTRRIFCAPGNAGTASLGTNVPIPAHHIPNLASFAKQNNISLTIVGPDDPLALGIVDHFRSLHLPIFGPTSQAARLESSKSFAKNFMLRHGIPTAEAHVFDDPTDAYRFCQKAPHPLVIKADGLALGKGVTIAQNPLESALAIHRTMELKAFGTAGQRILIEEFLTGTEVSIHALIDDSGFCILPDARDHKRLLDGNLGPNTGGMGTISPSNALNDSLWHSIRSEILDRFIAGLRADNIPYQGVLFPGIILTPYGPKVLEFNCRFGDPETQVLMRRLESDLLELLLACVENRVASQQPTWSPYAAACIIMASSGYPGPFEKGHIIHGLDSINPPAIVFHAGTSLQNHHIITSGGRVLGISATGPTTEAACQTAYQEISKIHFPGAHYRKDIGS